MADPQIATLNTLLQQLLSRLLHFDMTSPLDAQASQLLTNTLKQNIVAPMLGISPTDPIWNATLYSNMTGFGIAMQSMNTQANMRGISNMMQMQAAARYQFFEGLQRTVYSEEIFNKMPADERAKYGSYDKFIEHKVQGLMANQPLEWLMNNGTWDPTGKMMASANMREASANIARDALWRGDRNFSQKSDAVARMFMDEQLKLNYDKSDYGGMSLNETTALVAMLTKNMTLGGSTPEEIKRAVEDLRTRTQRLTEAMSPLKDFFGDDVPQMAAFLQEISGKSIQQLDSSEIQNLSTKIMNNVMVGNYSVGQIQKLTSSMGQTVAQMNLPYQLDGNVHNIASDILTITNSGFTPGMMSYASYYKEVTDRSLRQAASGFANNVNLAYAMWSSREDVEDNSVEAFREQYNKLLNQGLSDEKIMLEMSRAGSIAELAYYGYGKQGYKTAAESNLGGTLSRQRSMDERWLSFMMTRGSDEERQAATKFYDLLTDTGRDFDTAELFRRIERGDYGEDVAEISRTLQYDEQFKDLRVDMTSMAQLQDANQKVDNANRMRERIAFRERLFGTAGKYSETAGDFLRDFFLNGGQGFSMEDIKAAFGDAAGITAIMEPLGLSEKEMENVSNIANAVMASFPEGTDDRDITNATLKAVHTYLSATMQDSTIAGKLQPFIDAYVASTELPENATYDDVLAAMEKQQKAAKTLNFAMKAPTSILDMYSKLDNTGAMLTDIFARGMDEWDKLSGVTNIGEQVNAWIDSYNLGKEDADEAKANLQKLLPGWDGARGDSLIGKREEIIKNYEDMLQRGEEDFALRFMKDEAKKQYLLTGGDAGINPTMFQARSSLEEVFGLSTKDYMSSFYESVIAGGMSVKDWTNEQFPTFADDMRNKIEQSFNTVKTAWDNFDTGGQPVVPDQGTQPGTSVTDILPKIHQVLDGLLAWLTKQPDGGRGE